MLKLKKILSNNHFKLSWYIWAGWISWIILSIIFPSLDYNNLFMVKLRMSIEEYHYDFHYYKNPNFIPDLSMWLAVSYIKSNVLFVWIHGLFKVFNILKTYKSTKSQILTANIIICFILLFIGFFASFKLVPGNTQPNLDLSACCPGAYTNFFMDTVTHSPGNPINP